MSTTLVTEHGIDPAAPTTPMPRVDMTLQLSTRTVAWLADRPCARELVHSVWDKLAQLERAARHPDTIAALRVVLVHHQPTSAGRCRTCRRWTWRRPPFPCVVWHQIRGELMGPPAGRPITRTRQVTLREIFDEVERDPALSSAPLAATRGLVREVRGRSARW